MKSAAAVLFGVGWVLVAFFALQSCITAGQP